MTNISYDNIDLIKERIEQLINSHPSSSWTHLALDGRRVDSIKEIRSLTGLGLKEAKDVCDYFLYEIPAFQQAEKIARAARYARMTPLGASTVRVKIPDTAVTLVVTRTPNSNESIVSAVINYPKSMTDQQLLVFIAGASRKFANL